jgi:hypothetical protein
MRKCAAVRNINGSEGFTLGRHAHENRKPVNKTTGHLVVNDPRTHRRNGMLPVADEVGCWSCPTQERTVRYRIYTHTIDLEFTNLHTHSLVFPRTVWGTSTVYVNPKVRAAIFRKISTRGVTRERLFTCQPTRLLPTTSSNVRLISFIRPETVDSPAENHDSTST